MVTGADEARAILQSVESVKGFSSMRGKRERCSEQMESNSRGTDSEKGNFSPVDGFDSLHWVITPQEVLKRFYGHLKAIYTHEKNERFLYSFSAHLVPFSGGFYAKLQRITSTDTLKTFINLSQHGKRQNDFFP